MNSSKTVMVKIPGPVITFHLSWTEEQNIIYTFLLNFFFYHIFESLIIAPQASWKKKKVKNDFISPLHFAAVKLMPLKMTGE